MGLKAPKGEGGRKIRMRRIFVSLEPYYFDCYEEGGRKRRRTLVFSGVIKDIDCYEEGGREKEE